MHLWPSMRIRDSFKIAYLTNYERNLRRMNSDKQNSPRTPNAQLKETLIGDANNINGVVSNGAAGPATWSSASSTSEKAALLFNEILMLLSCCYCCFCCGVCILILILLIAVLFTKNAAIGL